MEASDYNEINELLASLKIKEEPLVIILSNKKQEEFSKNCSKKCRKYIYERFRLLSREKTIKYK